MELPCFPFLSCLDEDLRQYVRTSLKVHWTHASNALEGNTFSLGDTLFILSEGLTVSGKTFREHADIIGHADAVDCLAAMALEKDRLEAEDLFTLHRLVMNNSVCDIYKPIGGWKVEPNGTTMATSKGLHFHEYPDPENVPVLMKQWLNTFNSSAKPSRESAPTTYAILHTAFVAIHPFFDGNGRMARLLANFPLLKAGLPPIIIPAEQRRQYLIFFQNFSQNQDKLFPDNTDVAEFSEFLKNVWQKTWEIVDAAQQKQEERDARRPGP